MSFSDMYFGYRGLIAPITPKRKIATGQSPRNDEKENKQQTITNN